MRSGPKGHDRREGGMSKLLEMLKPAPGATEVAVAAGSALVPVPASPLDKLVAEYWKADRTEMDGIRDSVNAQIKKGELLKGMRDHLKQNGLLKYWGAWVKQNCGVTLRQVQRYIRKYEEFIKLSQRLGDSATSMSLILERELAKLKPEP
jgi:hypothetical protein